MIPHSFITDTSPTADTERKNVYDITDWSPYCRAVDTRRQGLTDNRVNGQSVPGQLVPVIILYADNWSLVIFYVI